MEIDQNNVHVWEISLTKALGQRNRFSDILRGNEKERAARFHFQKDRDQFVNARASMRLILARYLKESPDQIEFRYGPHGKPEVQNRGLEPRLHFNLSHSHEIALLAVARGRRVGVDVERVSTHRMNDLGLAENLFTPFEAGLLRAASPEMRAEVFYRLWTRKEAFLKGCGDGLSASLNHFEVSLEDSGILLVDRWGGGGGNWSVHEFRPLSDYIAAVAVEGAVPCFTFHHAEL